MASSRFKNQGPRLSRVAKRYSENRMPEAGQLAPAPQTAQTAALKAWEAGKISWPQYQAMIRHS